MAFLVKSLRKFVKAEDGPTAVEYAVMLALILMVCFAAVYLLGQQTNSTFNAPKLVKGLQAG